MFWPFHMNPISWKEWGLQYLLQISHLLLVTDEWTKPLLRILLACITGVWHEKGWWFLFTRVMVFDFLEVNFIYHKHVINFPTVSLVCEFSQPSFRFCLVQQLFYIFSLTLSVKFQWIMIIYDFYEWIWKSVHVLFFSGEWGCPKRLHVSTWIIKWNSPCVLLSAEYLCYQDSDSNWVIQEISCND